MSEGTLRRDLGLGGALVTGLGSILGTGVFVALGLGAAAAGPAVLPAVVLAGGVALCNGLSSAQLAAAFPTSGGTYEYGRRLLSPAAGFTAGWLFLCAKTASAVAALIAFSAYLAGALGLDARGVVAAATTLALTALAASGIRRSARANAVLVAVALLGLAAFVAAAAPGFEADRLTAWSAEPGGFLRATALMFVAFTGYGRVATLGEEVREPRRTIPRAIVITLAVSAAVYVLVAGAAIGGFGAAEFARRTAQDAEPLAALARNAGSPFARGAARVVSVGAAAALLGVAFNLILGLSRVLFAMGRAGDAPALTARVSEGVGVPGPATWIVGLAIASAASFGDLASAWSFSAVTVLVYYALTNLAALRLAPEQRFVPRVFAWVGLAGCLGLSVFVEPRAWLVGAGAVAAGFALRALVRARRVDPPQ